MKIDLDDPNLTAYALGELTEPEQSRIAAAMAESPAAQQFVRETQQLARLLKTEFRFESERTEAKPLNIMPLPQERSFWSDARWMSVAVAALLALSAVVAAIVLSNTRQGRLAVAGGKTSNPQRLSSIQHDSVVQMEVQNEPSGTEPSAPLITLAQSPPAEFSDETAATATSGYDGKWTGYRQSETSEAEEFRSRDGLAQRFNTAEYDHFAENPFLPAATNPLSTFSIDVDTASYANVRRLINSGSLPPKDAVRIEELVNYFTYDYPQPENDEPFSVNLDVTGCPWQPGHRLVRIGLKGRDIAPDQRGASNLVFLLDVSGSMAPAERLPLVKQAMRLLVEKLTEDDRVAIVVYAGASGVALPSTPGNQKERIDAALEELKAGGSTNGAEGISLAYKIAADNFIRGGVNRVILATDGDFNVGVTSQGELVRLAEEKAKSGVFLTVLGVGGDNLKDSTMQKLADKGNGNHAFLDSLEEARKVLVQQMNSTLVTIAKDVKIQVEFNPARVDSYRLLGYEKRMLRKEDFNNDQVDAGEIGAGHTVTALYEVVPVGARVNPAASVPPVDALKYQTRDVASMHASARGASSPELLTVKLRYEKPDDDESASTERTLTDSGAAFANASADFKFAAAVTEFGMILRDSPHKGNGTLGAVIEWAHEGKGIDEAGYRDGFIDLVRKAQALAL